MRGPRKSQSWIVWAGAFAVGGLFLAMSAGGQNAQQDSVTVQVEITRPAGKTKSTAGADTSNIVVWLTPTGGTSPAEVKNTANEMPQLVQRNKTFEPHVLAVQAGTLVGFPNKDPFLHNVFSLFDGKRFDLGFYEAGSTRSVRFDKPGVSFLFCNIHPEMSAVVVAVDTPYFGVSDRAGRVTIRNVPDGTYRMQVWYERSTADELKAEARSVTISRDSRSLPVIHLTENPNFSLEHKNKYGQDYAPAAANPY